MPAEQFLENKSQMHNKDTLFTHFSAKKADLCACPEDNVNLLVIWIRRNWLLPFLP